MAGLDYLHGIEIVHGTLSPDEVVIEFKSDRIIVVKIAKLTRGKYDFNRMFRENNNWVTTFRSGRLESSNRFQTGRREATWLHIVLASITGRKSPIWNIRASSRKPASKQIRVEEYFSRKLSSYLVDD